MGDENKSPTNKNVNLRRNTRGIMNYLFESPNRPRNDVLWAKDTPVKNMDAEAKLSTEQPTTLRPTMRRFLSSPVIAVRHQQRTEPTQEVLAKKAQIDQRLCEELAKQFGDVFDYKPRSLLNTLSESTDDSSQNERLEGKSKSLGSLHTVDDETDPYCEFDNIDFLAQLEEEARKTMEEKLAKQASNSIASTSKASIEPSPPCDTEKSTLQEETLRPGKPDGDVMMNSDDDDDDIMLSIPLECLTDPAFCRKYSSNNLKLQDKPTASSAAAAAAAKNSTSFTTNSTYGQAQSVMPLKRHHTNLQNSSHSFKNEQKPQQNSDEPSNSKKICTMEEIELKRQEALKRREEFLKSRKILKRK